MSDAKGCAGCRHHHKSERRKALELADGDMELVAYEDDDKPQQWWFVCMHETQLNKEMGVIENEPGQDCELFELPQKAGLSPELERLLAQRDSR